MFALMIVVSTNTIAKLIVPAGAPVHASGGECASPAHVKSALISISTTIFELVSVNEPPPPVPPTAPPPPAPAAAPPAPPPPDPAPLAPEVPALPAEPPAPAPDV